VLHGHELVGVVVFEVQGALTHSSRLVTYELQGHEIVLVDEVLVDEVLVDEVQGTVRYCPSEYTNEVHGHEVVFVDEVQGTLTYCPSVYTNELHGHESDVFVKVEVEVHQSPYDHASSLFMNVLQGQEVVLLVEVELDGQGNEKTSSPSL
jgi:hypothetical protein